MKESKIQNVKVSLNWPLLQKSMQLKLHPSR